SRNLLGERLTLRAASRTDLLSPFEWRILSIAARTRVSIREFWVTRPSLGRGRNRGVFLQFAQVAPAFVLLGLGWIGIFFSLEPKAKPIHGGALRDHLLPRVCYHMFAVRNNKQVHGLAQLAQRGVRLPHAQDTAMIVECDDLQWRFYFVHI